MRAKKYRKRSQIEVFLRNLGVVIQERFAAFWAFLSMEWDYYVTRAWVWRNYKELSVAEYDRETGQFQSSIDPQSVNEAE